MKQLTYANLCWIATDTLLAEPTPLLITCICTKVYSVKFSLMMSSAQTTNHKTGTSNVSANKYILIRMKDQTVGEMMFTIKKLTKMSTIFSAYAQRKGVKQASLRFLGCDFVRFGSNTRIRKRTLWNFFFKTVSSAIFLPSLCFCWHPCARIHRYTDAPSRSFLFH